MATRGNLPVENLCSHVVTTKRLDDNNNSSRARESVGVQVSRDFEEHNAGSNISTPI